MRRGVTTAALGAALAGLLGSCFDEGPRFGGHTNPKARAPSTAKFAPAAVAGYHFFNEPYGQRREVHFLAGGPPSTHERQARECVAYYLDHDVAAPFCFAYPSRRAFDASKFRPDNGQTGPSCWDARAQKPADSELDSELVGPDKFLNRGCPDFPNR